MTNWILATLGLYFIQTMIAPVIQYTSGGRATLMIAMTGRDNPPEMSAVTARIDRATHNMVEALLVFIPLSLLAIILGVADGQAATGAMIFFFARVVYIPAYASGIAGVRTSVWTVGTIGLIMILLAVLGAT